MRNMILCCRNSLTTATTSDFISCRKQRYHYRIPIRPLHSIRSWTLLILMQLISWICVVQKMRHTYLYIILPNDILYISHIYLVLPKCFIHVRLINTFVTLMIFISKTLERIKWIRKRRGQNNRKVVKDKR